MWARGRNEVSAYWFLSVTRIWHAFWQYGNSTRTMHACMIDETNIIDLAIITIVIRSEQLYWMCFKFHHCC
nr:hypothetical protein Iba_chr09bCG10510 [Ipomoea batatas]